MGLFTRSFDKPGPGVDPDAPQKRSFFRFFDIFFRKFWHFMKTNLIYTATLIPTFIIVFFLSLIIIAKMTEGFMSIIGEEQISAVMLLGGLLFTNLYIGLWGMGPATAGMTYIMRNFAREEHAWLWSDFKDNMKSNFKQSAIVFLIDILMMAVFYVAIVVYSSMGGFMGALRYVIFIMLIIYTLMHFYIYPMMITFELSLKDLYRNALLFAVSKLPSNIFIAAIVFGIHIGLPFCAILYGGKYFVIILFILFVLEIFISQAFTAFLVNFNAYPKIKKYMLDFIDEAAKKEPEEAAKAESIVQEMPDNADYDKMLSEERFRKWDESDNKNSEE